MMSRISVRQMQFLDRNTSTGKVYEQYAKTSKFTPQSVVLPDGTTAHWLGRKEAKRVLLWMSGGGFVLPASRFHFQSASSFVGTLNQVDRDAAVLFLSSDLAPAKQFPHQLRQAVSMLKYLLNETGRPVYDISLAGDSTGGHLLLALLSHISQPLPNVDSIVLSDFEKFEGAVLISPTVSFNMAYSSVNENGNKDWIPTTSLRDWEENYIGDSHAQISAYTDPTSVPDHWWSGMKVKRTLVVSGDCELFRDAIEVWTRAFAKFNVIDTIVGKGEFHDQPVMDFMLGVKPSSKAAQETNQWIRKHLWA